MKKVVEKRHRHPRYNTNQDGCESRDEVARYGSADGGNIGDSRNEVGGAHRHSVRSIDRRCTPHWRSTLRGDADAAHGVL